VWVLTKKARHYNKIFNVYNKIDGATVYQKHRTMRILKKQVYGSIGDQCYKNKIQNL